MSSYDLVTHFFSILNNTPLSGCACVCFSCFSPVWLFDPVEGSPLDSVRGSPDDDIWCGAYIHMLTYYLHIFFGQHSELSVQFRSVTQSCPTLCDPMDSRMPGFHVHHQLPELTQTHVHWVGDAIQPSHPLSSPSPPAFNHSQHQGLFKWVSSSHQMAKVLEFQLQHPSFQWIFRTDFLRLDWLDLLAGQGTLKSIL